MNIGRTTRRGRLTDRRSKRFRQGNKGTSSVVQKFAPKGCKEWWGFHIYKVEPYHFDRPQQVSEHLHKTESFNDSPYGGFRP
ncbi:hypothetical protein, partial [Hoylesella saccharolytica]|uniref:hypothetical protein n=1 Tax=Hoylesella saccharolytica TaxID=633701 RepID=UPI001F48CEDE